MSFVNGKNRYVKKKKDLTRVLLVYLFVEGEFESALGSYLQHIHAISSPQAGKAALVEHVLKTTDDFDLFARAEYLHDRAQAIERRRACARHSSGQCAGHQILDPQATTASVTGRKIIGHYVSIAQLHDLRQFVVELQQTRAW